MSDLLIRDVPDEVVSAIDARALKLGLSRTQYLRRRLAQEVCPSTSVSIEDLRAFSRDYSDLADPAVMSGAWA